MSKVKLLETNTSGRDFVVGDMHGMYDQFKMFLDYSKFDPEKDRMFSVGDLADRGPDSHKCMNLLIQPWFHAVRGNHEQMFLDFVKEKNSLLLFNGGFWVSELSLFQTRDLAAFVEDLPSVIVVGNSFNVVHADFYHENVKVTQQDFLDVNSGYCQDGPNHLWGRNYFLPFYGQSLNSVPNMAKVRRVLGDNNFAKDVLPTYCGHTPVRNPLQVFKLINLDTGAFFTGKNTWAGLTFTEPKTGKFWKVSDDVYETNLEVF